MHLAVAHPRLALLAFAALRAEQHRPSRPSAASSCHPSAEGACVYESAGTPQLVSAPAPVRVARACLKFKRCRRWVTEYNLGTHV